MSAPKMLIAMTALLVGTAGAAMAADALSEPQARAVMSDKCSNVSSLSRDRGGNWHGNCSTGAMMVDTSGKVSPDKGSTGATGLSEGQARAAMSDKCSNVSTLSEDSNGNWHGNCSTGAMMVDPTGKVAADKGGASTGLSEGNARSIASDACSNVSSLANNSQGSWVGNCSKGFFTIDKSGKIAFK